MSKSTSIISSIFLQKENEHHTSAVRVLEKAKKMEKKYQKKMKTIVLNNGTIVSCNNQEKVKEYIEKYGEREF